MNTGMCTIIVRPIKANLKRDTNWFFRMDPMVEVILGGEAKYKSPEDKNGGKHPHWNTIIGHIGIKVNEMDLTVYDKGLNDGEPVGHVNVNLEKLYRLQTVKEWYPLEFRGKQVGEIYLQMEYFPAGQSSPLVKSGTFEFKENSKVGESYLENSKSWTNSLIDSRL